MIYNEILVLNFCGIGEFTKSRIINRSIQEQDEALLNFYDVGLTPGQEGKNSIASNLVGMNSKENKGIKNELDPIII